MPLRGCIVQPDDGLDMRKMLHLQSETKASNFLTHQIRYEVFTVSYLRMQARDNEDCVAWVSTQHPQACPTCTQQPVQAEMSDEASGFSTLCQHVSPPFGCKRHSGLTILKVTDKCAHSQQREHESVPIAILGYYPAELSRESLSATH